MKKPGILLGVSLVGGLAVLPGSGCTSSSGDSRASGGQTSVSAGGTSASGAPGSGGRLATAGESALSGGSSSASGGTPPSNGGATSASGGTSSVNGGASATAGGVTSTGGTLASAGGAASGGVAGSMASGGAAGTTGVSCPASVLKSGDSNQTVQVGTLNRSYVLHIPTGYTGNKPLPVVIDFHPLGGTGAQWEGSSGWKSKADSAGFIVAYPNSYNSNNSWNVGMCCQDAQQNQIDDVAFTKAMIQQIEAVACVDSKRVYATGCSNGGGMTYKAACDLADMIAAAAPVDFRCVYGGSTSSPSCEGCKPSRPISITHFDNTGDTQLVPYNGGLTSFPADCPHGQTCTGMGFPSAQDNFKTWQQLDMCTGSPSALSGHAACQTNGSCQDSAQVTMCVQQGGSHCGNYASLGIVDIAWEMFQKQALP